MAPLPARLPDTDRRWVLSVPPDPYLRFDTCDYSLDPAFVGRRVEARVTDREVLAIVLDTGEIACRHPRSFAKHRTITALEHARALKAGRGQVDDVAETTVEIRPLARYDAADRMSRPTTELTHLFRQLKAPAAARALPKLADRARAEDWSYEQFAAVLLKTETDSRDSHGGQARIKAARFPARKTLGGVRLRLSDLGASRQRAASRPAGLPRRQRERRAARPARAPARRTSRSRSGSAPASPATASRSERRPSGSRCSPTPNAKAAWTQSSTSCNASRC